MSLSHTKEAQIQPTPLWPQTTHDFSIFTMRKKNHNAEGMMFLGRRVTPVPLCDTVGPPRVYKAGWSPGQRSGESYHPDPTKSHFTPKYIYFFLTLNNHHHLALVFGVNQLHN